MQADAVGLPRCGSTDVSATAGPSASSARSFALPGVELLRLDSDVAGSYRRLRAVLAAFGAPGPKVLVGTQMIAKGHHFPDVTLVGVVDADVTLHFPDFRAEERTFAMLVQVAGRSGRGQSPGRVVVQTLSPAARPIARAAAAEQERFYAEELAQRRALGYPPASGLIGLELSSPAADKAGKGAAFVAMSRLSRGGRRSSGPPGLSHAAQRPRPQKATEMGSARRAAVARQLPSRFMPGRAVVADDRPQWRESRQRYHEHDGSGTDRQAGRSGRGRSSVICPAQHAREGGDVRPLAAGSPNSQDHARCPGRRPRRAAGRSSTG
jgi:superfamily II DNA/RNA helicase